MKRLVMVAVTGLLVCALGACGGDNTPPVPDANKEDAMSAQMQQPEEQAAPAAEEPAAPTDEQVTGASTQE